MKGERHGPFTTRDSAKRYAEKMLKGRRYNISTAKLGRKSIYYVFEK